MPEPLPPIDYSSRDYVALRADLIAAKRARMPEWTSESPNDFGIVLLELFAYVGDMLSFYTDRVANEAYLDTAVLRSSVYAIARMLDYRPTGLGAASTVIQFTATDVADVPAGTRVQTVPVAGEAPIVFETDTDLAIPGAGALTVAATQGITVTAEAVGSSDGTADQVFPLFLSPVIDASPIVTVGGLVWLFYDHLLDAGPNDTAYTSFVDEGGITRIQFGDDVNGRVPVGAVSVTYRVGNGAAGNLGVGKITQLTSPVVVSGDVQPISGVTNTVAATGGADPETLDSIRINAPKSLTTINRAVTMNDYAALALRVTGVGKSAAYSSVATAVRLYVAPTNSPGGTCSAAVKTSVSNYLAARKMIGTAITIADPTYVNVDVTASIEVLPTYRRETVRQAVIKAVQQVLTYNTVDFKSRITVSRIYHSILSTEGVDYGNLTMLGRTPGTPGTFADVVTVVDGTNGEIPQAGTITITASGGIV